MIWDFIKHFSPDEAWGKPGNMNGLLLLLIDAIRERWGDARFIVHCGFEILGHAKDSEHSKGNAVDFHIESSLPFSDQIKRLEAILKELQVFNKVGLGIYPDWKHPGFHLDVRGVYARWGRIGGTYVGWNDAIEYAAKKPA